MKRISGLDSLRFICALVVFVGHLGGPLPAAFDGDAHGLMGRIIASSAVCLFNGPAAVIVFFLISGFCIHYPQTKGLPLSLRSFYVRRLVRIGIPAIFAWVLYLSLGLRAAPPEFGVLWSIVCEIIYYLLYPLLLILTRRYSWRSMLVLAFALAFITAAIGWPVVLHDPGNYVVLGSVTWIIGLPTWIMGCLLAEYVFSHPPVFRPVNRIWAWRITVMGAALAARALKFHVSPPWSVQIILLTALVPLIYIWLREEIWHFQSNPPRRWLEAAGAWSYSLYLTHIVAMDLARRWLGVEASKMLVLGLGLVLAYGFYMLVERSSYRLARQISG